MRECENKKNDEKEKELKLKEELEKEKKKMKEELEKEIKESAAFCQSNNEDYHNDKEEDFVPEFALYMLANYMKENGFWTQDARNTLLVIKRT